MTGAGEPYLTPCLFALHILCRLCLPCVDPVIIPHCGKCITGEVVLVDVLIVDGDSYRYRVLNLFYDIALVAWRYCRASDR